MNEESVAGVMDYFKQVNESEERLSKQVMQFNPEVLKTMQMKKEALK